VCSSDLASAIAERPCQSTINKQFEKMPALGQRSEQPIILNK